MSTGLNGAAQSSAEDLVSLSDPASARWIADLTGDERAEAEARLHRLLLNVARRELIRRQAHLSWLAGPELGDLAHQAAADAMLAILRKLPTFRGESRFTTWAYRFAILEVSAKLGRHHRRVHPDVSLDHESWERLPDRFGIDPGEHAEGAELARAVRHAVEETLTVHQRRLFTAIVLDAMPLDAVTNSLGTNRNAVYKTLFDARRKIRAYLVAGGYLEYGGASSTSEDRART